MHQVHLKCVLIVKLKSLFFLIQKVDKRYNAIDLIMAFRVVILQGPLSPTFLYYVHMINFAVFGKFATKHTLINTAKFDSKIVR
jgi:hypothetical protein